MKIGVIGIGTGLLNAQIDRELTDRGHEAIFVAEIPDFTTEHLGSLNEVLKHKNEALVKEIFEMRALPRDNEFLNPAFPGTNRQSRRKADREAKRNLKKKRN